MNRKTIIDIALNYSKYEYRYPDLFPVNGDIRPELDNINDEVIKLLETKRTGSDKFPSENSQKTL